MSKVKKIYEKELKKIIDDKDNKAVLLVGSSKYIDFENNGDKVNDIDIFIIRNQKENQVRQIKIIDNVEFDINYFSNEYANYLINDKEYFFINEMKDAKVIYDCNNICEELISKSNIKYKEGPKNNGDLHVNSVNIYENISRLENKGKLSKCEYEFLTNLYLKDIISEYFIINNKWIPKDKKIFNYLSENDVELFKLIECVYEEYNYKSLESVYKYVFKK